jgi:hypothetical protein
MPFLFSSVPVIATALDTVLGRSFAFAKEIESPGQIKKPKSENCSGHLHATNRLDYLHQTMTRLKSALT